MKRIDSNVLDRIHELLREREFEDKIKDITSEVFEKFFKMMYTKRGFWKNDIKR